MPHRPDENVICHRCGAILTPGDGNFYVVRIEALADPSPPRDDPADSAADLAAEWEQIVDVVRELSAQELMDQVYRRVMLHLCNNCYRRWIEDPTASPKDC
jgi:hypothetical protein